MSTSPSWFDQEKFSRLVKKVGPKPVPETVPVQLGMDPENRAVPAEPAAPTSRISLVSKPPSLLSERRALPALPRRTAPLPSPKRPLSARLPQPPPVQTPPAETARPLSNGPSAPVELAKTLPVREEVKPEPVAAAPAPAASSPPEGDELTEAWHKMSQLNEELAYTIQERDQAINESNLLREELSRALAAAKPKENAVPAPDFSTLTEERDRARRDYATIRKQYETLKLEQAPREDSGKFRKELEQQVEGFRQKLEEKKQEIAMLKAGSGGSGADVVAKLKQEVTSLREQLARAKDEVSIAQRGLALSQKALHETRDTLREATEGTSLSRHNFDNLKNECAILAQQNSVLQAQNDQLARELSAAKSKLTTRL